jgi:hypothetical protein
MNQIGNRVMNNDGYPAERAILSVMYEHISTKNTALEYNLHPYMAFSESTYCKSLCNCSTNHSNHSRTWIYKRGCI